MKDSLKNRILSYCRQKGNWVSSAEIEDRARENNFKASNSSRRCRELQNEGLLDRRIIHGIVWYKHRPSEFMQELHSILEVQPKAKQLNLLSK